MINHTAAPITPEVLAQLCKNLGLPEENRAAMQAEVSELQKQMDQKVGFKYTPLRVGPNEIQLRRPPVFAAAVEATTKTFSHFFVYVGWGGEGGGIQYYSKSGDMYRAQLNVDQILAVKEKAFSAALEKLPTKEGVRPALEQLKGQTFVNLEQFHEAYMDIRLKAENEKPGVKPNPDKLKADIRNEIDTIILKLMPKTQWEIWFRQPNGKFEKQVNLPEKDVRIVEKQKGLATVSKDDLLSGDTIQLNDINVRFLPEVDPIELLRVKRDELLELLYVDSLHGRKGDGLPLPPGYDAGEFDLISPEFLKAVSAGEIDLISPEFLKAVTATRATYNLVSPFPENTASCATGGKDVILNAMRAIDPDAKAPPAPSNYLFGYPGEMKPRWDPLRNNAPEPVKERMPNPHIDISSLRDGPINIKELNERLNRQAQIIAAQPKLVKEPGGTSKL